MRETWDIWHPPICETLMSHNGRWLALAWMFCLSDHVEGDNDATALYQALETEVILCIMIVLTAGWRLKNKI